MKTLMTNWLVSAASLLFAVPLFGCDPESTELGSTVGEETSGGVAGTSSGGFEPTGEASSSGGEPAVCAAATDAAACAAVPGDFESSCLWVDMHTTDATCDLEGAPVGRCVASEYIGDGCATTSSCVEDTSVFTRELEDGTYEWFSGPTPCGDGFQDYFECHYDDSDPGPCECLCQGLGGIGSQECDPFGPACPNSLGSAQECEPVVAGDPWSCFPQDDGTSPTYGDECSLEGAPLAACAGLTTCLPAEGLGVSGCDGGEGGGCCAQLCDHTLDIADVCPDEGQVCQPFYEEDQAPAGYEHVGVCRLVP
ncbi:MAG: hypothetical protein ACRBN8_13615 [Nannocystales bacterium]